MCLAPSVNDSLSTSRYGEQLTLNQWVLGLLLLIAFILYLITSPFSVLSQWLIGDEVNVVEDFQKQYREATR